jgi:hypothetical protein
MIFIHFMMNKNEYDKTIDLEKIALWLNVTKGHIKRLLIDNFEDGKDYNEFKAKSTKEHKVSNNKKTILLTYECAKLLYIKNGYKKIRILKGDEGRFSDIDLWIMHKLL